MSSLSLSWYGLRVVCADTAVDVLELVGEARHPIIVRVVTRLSRIIADAVNPAAVRIGVVGIGVGIGTVGVPRLPDFRMDCGMDRVRWRVRLFGGTKCRPGKQKSRDCADAEEGADFQILLPC